MTETKELPALTQQQTAPAEKKAFTEDTVGEVLNKVASFQDNGNLKLPANYSAENALRSAWLLIQQTVDLDKRPALTVCTKPSIANALFDMVLQGLSPSKKQCYFIVYGNQLTMQRSYFGTIAISKRVAGVKDTVGVPVFEKDVFKYKIDLTTGIKTVTQHDQEFENIDVTKLKGAYAIVTYEDGRVEYEIMTINQITASWVMGKAKGQSPAHKNFPDQMACRTVINRALKLPVNSSNDDDLYAEVEENTYSKQVEAGVKLEIKENANGMATDGAIGFDEQIDQADDENVKEEPAPAENAPEKTNQTAKQTKVPF